MTFAETADRYAPRSEDIIGPYSRWPRRKPRRGVRALALASSVTATGIIVHCGPPLVS